MRKWRVQVMLLAILAYEAGLGTGPPAKRPAFTNTCVPWAIRLGRMFLNEPDPWKQQLPHRSRSAHHCPSLR
jgi:hypothetical protein